MDFEHFNLAKINFDNEVQSTRVLIPGESVIDIYYLEGRRKGHTIKVLFSNSIDYRRFYATAISSTTPTRQLGQTYEFDITNMHYRCIKFEPKSIKNYYPGLLDVALLIDDAEYAKDIYNRMNNDLEDAIG